MLERSPFARRWALLTCLVTLGVGTACGQKKPAQGVPTSTENIDRPVLPGARIELIEAAGRPTLQLVRRSGDPAGAVSVAVFPQGGSDESLLLSALLGARLRAAGWLELTTMVHGIGFIITREAESPEEVKAWFKDVRRSLHAPVKEGEVDLRRLVADASTAKGRVSSESPYAECMGHLGFEGPGALEDLLADSSKPSRLRDRLEGVRAKAAVASRVGLSVLGEPHLVNAAAEAHDEEWTAGEPIDDSFGSEERAAVSASQGGREVRIAVRLSDSEAALAGVRAIEDHEHPLHARLHALDSELEVTSSEVSLRPAGACAGLTISLGSEGRTPQVDKVAQIAALASQELSASVRQVLSEDEHALALLAPDGAVEAASLASWTAVRSARTGGKPQRIIEYRAPPAEIEAVRGLSSALTRTEKEWQGRTIPFAVRDESGQGEFWLLVASECGTLPETPEDTGLRAMTVSALATAFSGARGVTLEPYASAEAVGLIAHAPPLPGESVARHAERVARAAGAALSGAALDGRAVAATRDAQLDYLGSDPGVELMNGILGAGFPSLLSPEGDAKTVSTFGVADAERTREDLAQEPLRISVLASGGAEQGQAAALALGAWLAPLRAHPTSCPDRTPAPAAPGLWTLETIDEQVQPGAFIGVFAPTDRAIGKATEFLLNRPGGYFDRAFSAPGLAAHVKARYLGGGEFGALEVRVGAEAHLLEPAIAQARAVLAALAEGGIPESDAALARTSHERIEARASRSHRTRLVRLWQEQDAVFTAASSPVNLSSLRAFHKKLAADQHRVVVVTRRK